MHGGSLVAEGKRRGANEGGASIVPHVTAPCPPLAPPPLYRRCFLQRPFFLAVLTLPPPPSVFSGVNIAYIPPPPPLVPPYASAYLVGGRPVLHLAFLAALAPSLYFFLPA